MAGVKPIWKFKVRTVRSPTSIEKVVKIPNEVADQIGDYVRVTIESGRIVIEPIDLGEEGEDDVE